MAGLGRKILSAFLEVTPTSKATEQNENKQGVGNSAGSVEQGSASSAQSGYPVHPSGSGQGTDPTSEGTSRFSEYFDKLFSEANIPGPDYYEFSKMIEAMQAIPDEQSRFYAAYAGLYAQGVDKAKLLSTAEEYLRILETDSRQFHTTVDAAMQEKVQHKKAEETEKSERIRTLSREITDLQNQITALQAEIKENEEKIEASTGGYTAESTRRVARIQADIEKIKNYLH
jgi:hypothetical protein